MGQVVQSLKASLQDRSLEIHKAGLVSLLEENEFFSHPRSAFDKIFTLIQYVPLKRGELSVCSRTSFSVEGNIKKTKEELEDYITDLQDENEYLRLLLTRLQVRLFPFSKCRLLSLTFLHIIETFLFSTFHAPFQLSMFYDIHNCMFLAILFPFLFMPTTFFLFT